MAYLVSIDPGEQGAAVAWSAGGNPTETMLIKHQSKMEWAEQVAYFMRDIRTFLDRHKPNVVACEWPFFNETALEVARTGALVKLAYVVGRIAEAGHQVGASVQMVQVREWKGQLSKEAVEKRIRRNLGPDLCLGFKSHIWDAVGIGLYAFGRSL